MSLSSCFDEKHILKLFLLRSCQWMSRIREKSSKCKFCEGFYRENDWSSVQGKRREKHIQAIIRWKLIVNTLLKPHNLLRNIFHTKNKHTEKNFLVPSVKYLTWIKNVSQRRRIIFYFKKKKLSRKCFLLQENCSHSESIFSKEEKLSHKRDHVIFLSWLNCSYSESIFSKEEKFSHKRDQVIFLSWLNCSYSESIFSK